MKSLFVDLEFTRGRGDQVKKSWKFQGVGGSHVKPSGTENPGGWGLKLEKTLRGGVWIFSGTTHITLPSKVESHQKESRVQIEIPCHAAS